MQDISNTKILVCYHKKYNLPKQSFYLPIQVGKAISNINLDIQCDDKVGDLVCENISSKNYSFCELTALFWAWKNIKKIYPNIQYVGLCHYRRYFKNIEKDLYKLYKSKNCTIVSNYFIFPWSVEVQYKKSHVSDDFDVLKESVSELYPEYTDSFKKNLCNNNKTLYFNMFVMSVSDFEHYCEWLFTILLNVEKKINIDNYNHKQIRIFGYMAERLLLVYIKHNHIKMIHDDVINIEQKNISFIIKLKNILNKLRYSISFFFNKSR